MSISKKIGMTYNKSHVTKKKKKKCKRCGVDIKINNGSMEESRIRPIQIWTMIFDKDNSVRKRLSFQQMVLEQLKIHIKN